MKHVYSIWRSLRISLVIVCLGADCVKNTVYSRLQNDVDDAFVYCVLSS